METQFTWIAFYKELSLKLLQFKSDRKPLVDFIQSRNDGFINQAGKSLLDYLHMEDGSPISDIDPFSVFAIFNRGRITYQNRQNICNAFKSHLAINADAPTDFDGIPIVDPRRSFFFTWDQNRNPYIIADMWELYERVVKEDEIEEWYDKVLNNGFPKNSLTMALYWLNPDKYMTLDSRSRLFLETYGITKFNIASYKGYVAVLNDIKEKMQNKRIPYTRFAEISYAAWLSSSAEPSNDTDMKNNSYSSNIITLLENNKNLILTGAPGTGKTYMAKDIAAQMMFGKDYHSLSEEERGQIGFVQFHPSFDYTDFVEGIRPVQDENGNVGFKLRRGIFKEYCAKALEKYDSGNFDEAYDSMISEIGEDIIKLKTPQGNDFGVSLNSRDNLRLHTGKELKENGVLTRESLKAEFSGTPVYQWWKGYYAGVVDYIKSKYHVSQVQNDSDKKYVFIIDEINRGEISKIFGELFYSIDPGYRGTNGKVDTQYKNMIPEGDPFKEGFYVPENVYIIGTMNDIDRSVESMDFAMRRRFTWKEVTASDSYTAIIENNSAFVGDKAEVKQRMERLNAEIEKRLGRAYQIGAAYFLNLRNNDFESLWKNHLEGLLFEYFRGEKDAQQKVDALHAIYKNEPSDTNIG